MTPEMKAYLQEPNCPAPVALDIDGPVPELKSRIDILVDRFLSCPLPESVCADLCATRQGPGRYGTALLSGTEAKAVLSYVLAETFPECQAEAKRLEEVQRIKPEHLTQRF